MSYRKMVRIDKDNNVCLGEVVLGQLVATESGHYEFLPDLSKGGYWPSYLLREIANEVDRKNADWDAEIARYFADHPEREKP